MQWCVQLRRSCMPHVPPPMLLAARLWKRSFSFHARSPSGRFDRAETHTPRAESNIRRLVMMPELPSDRQPPTLVKAVGRMLQPQTLNMKSYRWNLTQRHIGLFFLAHDRGRKTSYGAVFEALGTKPPLASSKVAMQHHIWCRDRRDGQEPLAKTSYVRLRLISRGITQGLSHSRMPFPHFHRQPQPQQGQFEVTQSDSGSTSASAGAKFPYLTPAAPAACPRRRRPSAAARCRRSRCRRRRPPAAPGPRASPRCTRRVPPASQPAAAGERSATSSSACARLE